MYFVAALLFLAMVAVASGAHGQHPVSAATPKARAQATVKIISQSVRLQNGRMVSTMPDKSRFRIILPQRPQRRACPPQDARAPGCILIIHDME